MREMAASRAVALPATRLVDIGEALYGPSWRQALAQALGVTRRTVYRWETGQTPIAPERRQALADLCRARGYDLIGMADDIVAAKEG